MLILSLDTLHDTRANIADAAYHHKTPCLRGVMLQHAAINYPSFAADDVRG